MSCCMSCKSWRYTNSGRGECQTLNIYTEEDFYCKSCSSKEQVSNCVNAKLGDELLSSKLLYFLMHILDQYMFAWDFEGSRIPTGETRFNCEAEMIDYLDKNGYVKIVKGDWPETKRLRFLLTEKGKQFFA